MQLGKGSLKVAFSFSTRRIRLGVAHHGAPALIQPITPTPPKLPGKKKGR